jgi:hypothetical protein
MNAIRQSYTTQRNNTQIATMTQENLILTFLILILQAILDGQQPNEGELKMLLSFLTESRAVHGVHPSFHTSALMNWVDRLRQGILSASQITASQRKRRPITSASNNISLATSLSSPSSSFMALMMDALNTPEETPIIPESQPVTPRYTVQHVNKHGYNRATGRLEFSVSWVGCDAADTLESYSNLHHLHVLINYETRLHDLTQGKDRNVIKKQSRILRKYILQRDREAAAVLTEEDTDSDISELGEVLHLSLGGSPLIMGTPIAPTLDSPLTAQQKDCLPLLGAGPRKDLNGRWGRSSTWTQLAQCCMEMTALEPLPIGGMTEP